MAKVQHMYTEIEEGKKELPFELKSEFALKLDGTNGIIAAGSEFEGVCSYINSVRQSKLPVCQPEELGAAKEGQTVVLIGNAWNNKEIFELYRQSLSFVDSEYPGMGGLAVHSLFDPLGDGRSYIVIGGSDPEGVRAGAEAFVEKYGSRAVIDDKIIIVKGEYELDFGAARLGEMLNRQKNQLWNGYSHGAMRQMSCMALAGFLSGNRGMFSLMREVMLEYDRLVGERESVVIDSNSLIYFWSQALILNWQLVRDDSTFSNSDIHVIDGLIYNIVDWISQMDHFAEAYRSEVAANHRTFAMLSFYLGAMFLKRHYKINEYDDKLNMIDEMFGVQQRSWKQTDNSGSVYGWLSPNHIIRYAGLRDEWSFFESGNLKKLGDYGIMITNNLGRPSNFGDEVGSNIPWRGREGTLQVFGAAGWYYKDGRYKWAYEFTKPGENYVKFCDKYYRSFDGWPDLGCYVNQLEAVEPEDMKGISVARLDEGGVANMKTIRKVDEFSAAEDKLFDKLSMRTGFDQQSEYLLLEGCTGYYHTHEDINSIIGFTWKDRMFLNEAGYPRREARYHNSVVIVKDGQIEPKPLVAALEHSSENDKSGFVRSVCKGDNGSDWARNIIWRKGGWFVVIDEVEALEEGRFRLSCLWRGLGEVVSSDESFCVDQDGVQFTVANCDGSQKRLKEERMGNGFFHGHWNIFPDENTRVLDEISSGASIFTSPGGEWGYYEHGKRPVKVWYQDKNVKCDAGEKVSYLNTLYCPQDGQIKTERVGRGVIRLSRGDEIFLVGVAKEGFETRDLCVKAAGFVVSGESVELFGGSKCVICGEEIECGENTVMLNASQRDRLMEAIGNLQVYQDDEGRYLQKLTGDAEAVNVLSNSGKMIVHCSDISRGGKEYMLVSTTGRDLVLFDADGEELFRKKFDHAVSALTMTYRKDGLVCAVASGCSLFVFDKDGNLQWEHEFTRNLPGRPAERAVSIEAGDIDGDGEDEFVVGTIGAQRVYCFKLSGQMVWGDVEVLHWAVLSIATGKFSADGSIAVIANSQYGSARALGRDGSWKWAGAFGETGILTGADIDGDGIDEVLAGTLDGVRAVNGEDGGVLWEINLGGQVLKPIAFDLESTGRGRIAAASDAGQLVLADHKGSQLWRLSLREEIVDLAVLKDERYGFVIAAAMNGSIAVVSAEGEILRIIDVGKSPMFFKSACSCKDLRFVDMLTGDHCQLPLTI